MLIEDKKYLNIVKKIKYLDALSQGCPNLLLKGHCPVEFSSNPN